MPEWLDAALRLRETGEAFVLVTVAATRGSSPREAGAKMLVTRDQLFGTIGGGTLEHSCAREAAAWLAEPADGEPQVRTRRYPLGASFGQCCGGIVEVLFEEVRPDDSAWLSTLAEKLAAGRSSVMATATDGRRRKRLVTADDAGIDVEASGGLEAQCVSLIRDGGDAAMWTDPESGERLLLEPVGPPGFTVALFGAGHVGTALVAMLAELDCTVHWIDSRAELLERPGRGDVRPRVAPEPAALVAEMPPDTFYLVMTHSHPLDLEICARILRRGDAAYCGLIGSRSKRRRFEKQLRALGIGDDALRGLTCPIGIDGIDGKRPGEIAVAVAAQLLRERERGRLAARTGDATAAAGGAVG